MAATIDAPGTWLYRTLLGPAFEALHPNVRAAQAPMLQAEGRIDVVHGSHPLTRVLVGLLNLPPAGAAQPATLHVAPAADGRSSGDMIWNRAIGDWRFRTRQSGRRGLLVERSGFATIAFALREEQGALLYEQRWVRLLRVPVWSGLTPTVCAKVSPVATGWHVQVIVGWRGHVICRYSGTMSPVHEAL